MKTASPLFILIIFFLSAGCGFQPATPDSTSKPQTTQSALHLTSSAPKKTLFPSETASETSGLSPAPSTGTAIPLSNIPDSPSPIPDSWKMYINLELHIEFRYPGDWQAGTPYHYSGPDGYFELGLQPYPASAFDRFRTVCVLEANKDKPAAFGEYPYISNWWEQHLEPQVRGGVGCTVSPAGGYPATQQNQAILFARNPHLNPDRVLVVLKTDSAHFEGILSTLRFIEGSSPILSPIPSISGIPASSACRVTPAVPSENTSRSNGLIITEYAVVDSDCDPQRDFEGFHLRIRFLDADKPSPFVYEATQPSEPMTYKYAKDHLFPSGAPSQVNIYRNDRIIYTMSIPQVGPAGDPVRGLWTWDDHWVLELENVLIQDGTIQNLTLGYDEIFEWRFINGQPFYFFLKDSLYGFVYAGQTLPNRYDDVIHGPICCGFSLLSIYSSTTQVWFYALKGDVWYLVSVIPES